MKKLLGLCAFALLGLIVNAQQAPETKKAAKAAKQAPAAVVVDSAHAAKPKMHKKKHAKKAATVAPPSEVK